MHNFYNEMFIFYDKFCFTEILIYKYLCIRNRETPIAIFFIYHLNGLLTAKLVRALNRCNFGMRIHSASLA